MRRLLILGLFCLVLAGGAAVTWQAMGQAKLVEEDLTTARALLTRAGGFESGKLKDRLVLINKAEAHTLAAQQRLHRWPLRLLGALPLAGRDVRVASAVTSSATGTVRATRKVVTALQPLQTKPTDLGLDPAGRRRPARPARHPEAGPGGGPRRPAADHRRDQKQIPGGRHLGQHLRRASRPGPEAGRQPVRPAGDGQVVPGASRTRPSCAAPAA